MKSLLPIFFGTFFVVQVQATVLQGQVGIVKHDVDLKEYRLSLFVQYFRVLRPNICDMAGRNQSKDYQSLQIDIADDGKIILPIAIGGNRKFTEVECWSGQYFVTPIKGRYQPLRNYDVSNSQENFLHKNGPGINYFSYEANSFLALNDFLKSDSQILVGPRIVLNLEKLKAVTEPGIKGLQVTVGIQRNQKWDWLLSGLPSYSFPADTFTEPFTIEPRWYFLSDLSERFEIGAEVAVFARKEGQAMRDSKSCFVQASRNFQFSSFPKVIEIPMNLDCELKKW